MYATKIAAISEAVSAGAIRFGTDGWRAIIGDEFTFTNVERVSQAYACYLKQTASLGHIIRPKIVVGHDRRFLSNEFAVRASEVLVGNGFDVLMFDEDVPTPLVSWALRDRGAIGGVVITASHNPPQFNGFKVKADFGGSAPSDMTAAVEACIDITQPVRRPLPSGATHEAAAATQSYRTHVQDYVDLDRIGSADINVVIDPMHGSGGAWVESFLKGGRINAETVRGFNDESWLLFRQSGTEPILRLYCEATSLQKVRQLILNASATSRSMTFD